MNEGLETIINTTKTVLASRGWFLEKCSRCQRYYFTKIERPNCQDPACESNPLFLQLNPHGKPRLLSEIANHIKLYFRELNFFPAHLDNVVAQLGETLFIIAAIQVLDQFIYTNLSVPTEPLIVAQPSIRLNYMDRIGEQEGFSSSFVNVASEEFVTSIKRYSVHLNIWLDCLSSLGLHANQITLIAEIVPFDSGPYYGNYLIFNYAGIELGEGIYINKIKTKKEDDLRLLEFAFGLERILWAVNKTRLYYHNFGLLTARMQGNFIFTDAVRTATLMVMSGVQPSHRAQGGKLRLVIKKIIKHLDQNNLELNISHSYGEWSHFIKPVKSVENCFTIIQKEINRQINLKICAEIGIKTNKFDLHSTPEQFCDYLLKQGFKLEKILDVGNIFKHD